MLESATQASQAEHAVQAANTFEPDQPPVELIWPGLFLIGGLAADFLHYVVGSLTWGGYHRYREIIGTTQDEDFLAPRWMNWPGNLLFGLKLLLICVAYSLLILFLVDKLGAA